MNLKVKTLVTYLFLSIFCITTFSRFPEEEYDLGFQVKGFFAISILFLIYSFFSSKQFQIIFTQKQNILLLVLVFIGLINGLINNNELYWIKNDFSKIVLIYCGIGTVLLWPSKYIYDNSSPLYFILFCYFISIILKLMNSGEISLFSGVRYTSYVTLQFCFMLLPLFFMELVRKKIFNRSTKTLFSILAVIFFYEAFIAFMRTNILLIMIGIILYINISLSNNKVSVDVLKKILYFVFVLVLSVPLIFYLSSGYIDRSFSDLYRIYEASYVLKNYIFSNSLFGYGLGKTYMAPDTGQLIRSSVHLRFITVWLKLGLFGLITIIFLLLRPLHQFLLYSNSMEIFYNKKVVLLAPSLIIWGFFLTISNGTHPEQMFGLGLAIGSYIQFSNILDFVNNIN